MRHLAKLIAACAVSALMAAPVMADTPKDTLVVAKAIDDIISLDPGEVFEFSGGEVVSNVYDKLFSVDYRNDNKIENVLAESWSVSDDGLTYTIKLKPKVKFHSGNPLTAADVVYSFQRAVTLNKPPGFILRQFGFTAENVLEKIKAAGPLTVTITVAKPVAPTFFLSCLTSGVASIVDSKLVKSHAKGDDFGNDWLKLNSAGSGPFKVRAYRANEQYILEANPDWFAGKAKMKRIVVRHVAEPASQRLLLEKGDIDIARDLSPDQLAAIADNPKLKTTEGCAAASSISASTRRTSISPSRRCARR
jgi:peptide/nickel transport system substrate-binding protein